MVTLMPREVATVRRSSSGLPEKTGVLATGEKSHISATLSHTTPTVGGVATGAGPMRRIENSGGEELPIAKAYGQLLADKIGWGVGGDPTRSSSTLEGQAIRSS